MSYYNTGQARNKTLTVTKGETPHTYNLCAEFPDPTDGTITWPQLTDDEFRRLSTEEFEARLAAFCEHVYSLPENTGLRADCPDLAQGCVVWNPTMCPLPTAQQQQEH